MPDFKQFLVRLEQKQYDWLHKESYLTGKSKAEIIREALEKYQKDSRSK